MSKTRSSDKGIALDVISEATSYITEDNQIEREPDVENPSRSQEVNFCKSLIFTHGSQKAWILIPLETRMLC